MVQPKRNRVVKTEIADPRWNDLYRIGGFACLAVAILITLAIIAFFIWPYKPGLTSTLDVFTMLQKDRLGGLISMDLPMILIMLINILPLLALYVALKQVNESYALIALAVGLIAVIVLVPARPLVELATLSDKYAAAISPADKNQYLAAGEALLTLFGGTAWTVQTVFACLSGLISSMLMLRSPIFNKMTAYIGIVSAVLGFGFFLPAVGVILLFANTILSVVWMALVGRCFLRLVRVQTAPVQAAAFKQIES